MVSVSDHNHPQDEAGVRRGLLLKRIHERIKANPTIPVRRAYDDAAGEDSDDDGDYMPNFQSIRTRAKRVRAKFMPDIPHEIDEVDTTGAWSKTWKGRQFLTYLDNYWGLAVFTSSRMIRVLQRCECLYVDGTFRTAPLPYQQLITVHGLYNGSVVPLVFCLCTGKTVGQYRQLFQHLKRAVRAKTAQRLRPRRVVLDFEASLMIAIETEFPRCRLSAC